MTFPADGEALALSLFKLAALTMSWMVLRTTKLLVDGFSAKIARVRQELRPHPAVPDRATDSQAVGDRHAVAAASRSATGSAGSGPPAVRDTYAQLAAGFGIGIATAFRYIREAVDILATLAPSLAKAIKAIRAKAFVILDGTLLPIDRIAADTPYHSGKHKRHGMNVQVLTDPFVRLLWASPALPGTTHDLTAARQHGIIEARAEAGLRCWADKTYQGAGGTLRVPFRGRRHNTTHAKICCIGEQAMATPKGWQLLRKLRRSTNRITDAVKAALVLHHHASA